MDLATIILSLGMLGSVAADTETAMAARARGYQELNPVMRPVADSRMGLYAVKGSVAVGVGVLSHRLRQSPKKHERILGWALPALSIGVQSLAARHNHQAR